MKLGGVKNGNGRQEIYDNRGNLIGRLDNTGLTFYYSYSQQGQDYSYTGITLNKDGLIYVEEAYSDGILIGTDYEHIISFNSNQTGVEANFTNLMINGNKAIEHKVMTATLSDSKYGLYRVGTVASIGERVASIVSRSNDVSITSFFRHVSGGDSWYVSAILPLSGVASGVSSIPVDVYILNAD